jgi:3-hydroxyisobutyrate dehydrogenase-like beta-hydroxyacid dehydrogenase
MLQAGVIGLGQIGGGVAVCLARAGRLAAVYDVYPEVAAKLEGVPACVSSPAELASSCDVVIIAVVSAEQVRDALSGPDGLLSGARDDLTVVLMSTVSLPDLHSLSELAGAAGVKLVDCGVTGGPAAARKGLVCLVGADDADYQRVLPVLEDCSQTVVRMGGPAAGMAAKVARNVLVYGTYHAAYEAAKLAESAGVDLATLAAAIDASAASMGSPMAFQLPLDPVQTGGRDEKLLRQATAEIMRKDLAAATELARALDIELQTPAGALGDYKGIFGLED